MSIGNRIVAIQTWDLQVRLCHWTLAAFVLAAYFVEGNWRALHTHLGYTIMLLVVFRILWGIWGSLHARFTNFLTGPATAARYAVDLIRGSAQPYDGHDPAGAVMIVALLLVLIVTGSTGLVLYGMEGNGPLAGLDLSRLSGSLLERIQVPKLIPG